MVFGLAWSIPAFYLFFVSSGTVAIIAILLFGFALWSTFAVAVAMSHELLPQNVGLASGIMLGLAIGFGGLGVAVNGMMMIADHHSLAAAIGTIPIPIAGAVLLLIVLPYPWKSLKTLRYQTKEP
jgi:FSR family fosmidomycin resistance protein-like MFS transporter